MLYTFALKIEKKTDKNYALLKPIRRMYFYGIYTTNKYFFPNQNKTKQKKLDILHFTHLFDTLFQAPAEKLSNCNQGIQNRAARVLTYSNYDVDAGHLFKLLGFKNLTSQRQIQSATMVYKFLQVLAPENLSCKFERRETAHKLL